MSAIGWEGKEEEETTVKSIPDGFDNAFNTCNALFGLQIVNDVNDKSSLSIFSRSVHL